MLGLPRFNPFALVSRTTPAKPNATLMSLAFMSLFVSNNLIGWVAIVKLNFGEVIYGYVLGWDSNLETLFQTLFLQSQRKTSHSCRRSCAR